MDLAMEHLSDSPQMIAIYAIFQKSKPQIRRVQNRGYLNKRLD